MKNDFFASKVRKDLALSIAAAWNGVKYEHMGRTKRGVDCIGFVGAFLVEAGALARLKEFGVYYHDWYMAGENLMCTTIERHLSQNLVPGVTGAEFAGDIKTGDLLCLKIGSKVVNHTVIALSDTSVVHAAPNSGVVIDDLLRWKSLVAKTYRFYEGQ